jgi:hypothetical protein
LPIVERRFAVTIPPVRNKDFPEGNTTDVDPVPGKDEPVDPQRDPSPPNPETD